MASPDEVRDQVIGKIRTADAQTRPAGSSYTFTGVGTAGKILGQALGTPGAISETAVAGSNKEGNVVFGVKIETGRESEVQAAVKALGGDFFPDSEMGKKGEFTNDIRMPKAAFDRAMEAKFGIPANSNPPGPEIKKGLAAPPIFGKTP